MIRSNCAVLALASAMALAACPDEPPPPSRYAAEIRRTAFGVPHIKADDERGLGFGLGYAFEQDNLCLLADVIVTVNGERSKYFGPTATYDLGGGRAQANLSSDFYFKYLNDPDRVQASWHHQPAEIQDLLDGYAAGVNRALREVAPGARPLACRDQPWVREITTLDLIRIMRRFAVEASGAQLMDAMFQAQPPSPGKAPAPYAPSPASFPRSPLGSNGVALGADATASGRGLLLANPHFPWGGALRFYQAHLTIPGKVDVMGASLTGVPVINIGFNRDVAWTHTFDSSAHFTLFALALDPSSPTRYVVDGQAREMIRKPLSVEVLRDGALAVETRTYYLTEHGPVVVLPDAPGWTTETAFALRDANLDNDRLLAQWWAIDQATSVAELAAAVDRIVGLPWVQAIAADRAGQTYYGDVTPVPYVSAAALEACVPAALAPLIDSGIFVLAGNTAACAWQDDPAAPQPGVFPAAMLPRLVRRDFVQNSNDSAWLTNPAAPLTRFPRIVGAVGTPQGGRTRLGLTQIAARLGGSDGRPGNRFDLTSLQDIAFSNRSYFASILRDDAVAACTGVHELAAACGILAAWDGKAELASVGWPLFQAWRAAMDASGIDYARVPFDPADPIHTPRGLDLNAPEIRQLAREALGQAVQALDAAGLDYTRPWGELQVAVRGEARIPIHGGGGEDIYNVVESGPIDGGQLDASYGASTIWTVSFEGDAPIAQGFLAYSQSTDPASPHFRDQTERFSAKRWIEFPFTDAAIAADPELIVTTIHE